MLNISLYTVEAHRSHILQKPNLHNSAKLVTVRCR
jgi:DNA-binding NarL/FixJ family response regulator